MRREKLAAAQTNVHRKFGCVLARSAGITARRSAKHLLSPVCRVCVRAACAA
ncbi:hypothetical protein Z946_3606 [Sulfitobacter noctilucicola]|nr:hypothetical protein Z946_3606 [Sulfitobacter noctilucicola]